MKTILIISAVLAAVGLIAYGFVSGRHVTRLPLGKSFYDLSVKTLDGKGILKMSDYKGKKILCVNVASKCGYTPQYDGLQKLSEKYAGKLVIIGFPCNQFLGQEPGNNEEIAQFCRKNYGVTFPLSEKIDVKGSGQHEIYQWLCLKSNNGVADYEVKWNFNKFLVDEKGNLQAYFGSKTEPLSSELAGAIEQ